MSFRIETTTVDGRGQALLVCTDCAWYGDNISRRFHGRVRLVNGDGLWCHADLSQINDAADAHVCPPEVREVIAESRTSRETT